MSAKLLRLTCLIRPSQSAPSILSKHFHRTFTSTRPTSILVDSEFLSQITAAEKKITSQDEPVKGGPTARAQSHIGQQLTSQIIHDITLGERSITGQNGPMQGGPTSIAQHLLQQASNEISGNGSRNTAPSGMLDSNTISNITEREKGITGQDGPVKGGPTAKAQQHSGEPITSQALHDITDGEKKITGGERVKGGPTSAAQSALGKSRQQ